MASVDNAEVAVQVSDGPDRTGTVTLEDVVSSFRPDARRRRPNGEIEFTLGRVGGFSRLVAADRVARTSFFLRTGLSRREADRLLAAWPKPLAGELTRFTGPDGDVVRLLLDVALDEQGLRTAGAVGRTAGSYELLTDEDLHTDVSYTLASAGVTPPPLVDELHEGIRTHAPWVWGTRLYDPLSMYLLDEGLAELAAASTSPQLLLCQVRGALILFLSRGPVATFTWHRLGGDSPDPAADRLAVAGTYARLHAIFEGIDRHDPGPPRWLLRARGSEASVTDLWAPRDGAGARPAVRFEEESAAFEHLAVLPGSFGNPRTASPGEGRGRAAGGNRSHSGRLGRRLGSVAGLTGLISGRARSSAPAAASVPPVRRAARQAPVRATSSPPG